VSGCSSLSSARRRCSASVPHERSFPGCVFVDRQHKALGSHSPCPCVLSGLISLGYVFKEISGVEINLSGWNWWRGDLLDEEEEPHTRSHKHTDTNEQTRLLTYERWEASFSTTRTNQGKFTGCFYYFIYSSCFRLRDGEQKLSGWLEVKRLLFQNHKQHFWSKQLKCFLEKNSG